MDEVDPDAWEEQRRDADEHERDVLRRHLDGGLAPDAELEARVGLVGSTGTVVRRCIACDCLIAEADGWVPDGILMRHTWCDRRSSSSEGSA